MAREKCRACQRPLKNCLCSFVFRQSTELPILIVQHPDESKHPFTTSFLATLGASSVRLCCALDISESQCRSLLQLNSVDELALLYVDHHYNEHQTVVIDCSSPASRALIGKVSGLVVLDGTWRNTRELMLRNKWLTKLTTISLASFGESEYVIRKGEANTICTIEAIANLFHVLHPDFQLDTYLRPMRELVRQQNDFQAGLLPDGG